MADDGRSRPPGREGVRWAEFAQADPGLAARIKARFAANLHHVLGTIRPDGAPRLSGTEVAFEDGDVVIGMMPGSQKLRDVGRDPRVELHTAPLEEDLAGGDAKLAGVLVEIDRDGRGPAGTYFKLGITLAGLVRVEDDELVVMTWRPGRGTVVTRRT